MLLCARMLLDHPRGCWASLRLGLTCRAAQERLAPLRSEIFRLRVAYTMVHAMGQTFLAKSSLTQHVCVLQSGWQLAHGRAHAWAVCGPLPDGGRSCFNICIDMPHNLSTSASMRRKSGVHICVGVSNAEASVAWGLHLGSGQMRRWSRNAAGQVCGVPTPAGFPNGHRKQVLFDESGRPRDLGDVCTSGRVIDVVFDSDAGTLGFRIDRGPLLPGLSGFPKQVLRPFVRIGESDRVSICPSRDRQQ